MADPVQDVEQTTDSGREIIVTARRREEKLQDVPIAITALSADSLAAANVTRVQDIQQKVPGLTIQPTASGPNTLAPAIRGQRQFDAYITKDPAVAVYFADVVQNRPQGLNSALFDLQSVQVLKGPQGTLFGRNTTGGALIITPAEPTNAFGGYVTAAIGNYEMRRLEGAINIPISDTLQLRLAGSLTRREGYTRNYTTGQLLDDDHKNSWRASLKWEPADWFSNRLVLNGFEADENGVGYRAIGIKLGTPAANLYPQLPAIFAAQNALPFHSTTSNLVNFTDIKTFGLSNVTQVDLGGITFKNIFGYRYVYSYVNFDYDGLPIEAFRSDELSRSRQISDEAQFLGEAFGGDLNYIFGGFYFREKGFNSMSSLSLGSPRPNIGDPIVNRSYSFFGQVNYRLPFLPGVSVTAGARQTYDERFLRTKSTTNGVCRLRDANGMPLNPCQTDLSTDFDKLTYTLSVDWKINPDVLIYLAHRRGYRTGGYNFGGNTLAELAPFRPEVVEDFELGVKTEWRLGDVRGRFNIAAYTQDYTDIQRNVGFFVNGAFATTIINAASAKINGVEMELSVTPVRNLDFSFAFSHVDFKYNKFIDPRTGGDLSNSEVAGIPRYSLNADVTWTLPLAGDAGDVVARADIYHQTHTNLSDTNVDATTGIISPTSIIPGYTLVNARLEWRNVMGSGASLALFGRNLLDEQYYYGGVDLAPQIGVSGAFTALPRTYGLEATFRF
ncbi:iron complex outermembrane receptor protein [Sphingobium wenxiniae]|uniref:TonB-denpendent receptor n=1 Tax=Sphingobium baderi LL03 TaxID=1114964 RepID=T0HJA5_9SPHN|nr:MULTISPECIES: TonB-dependent receptor [Sphingobium]EQA97663.1 hypothetical protein L485_20615 [Sphingobium baderi LL03]KMS63738.1 hypothetical protein V475_01510 [Sphingobium baderi LL03]MBB6193457.1 iron complex outermembrane receptor protein [Sphingobium wenxiniae]WRD77547.1 TonB-dependent receptor [Sphingobium baderi]